MTLIELARPQIFMTVRLPAQHCHAGAPAPSLRSCLVLGLSPGCGDLPSNRTSESSTHTGLGRSKELSPAPAQVGISVTSVTVGGVVVMSMTLRSTPDIRLDTRAIARRPEGESTGGAATRVVRPSCSAIR